MTAGCENLFSTGVALSQLFRRLHHRDEGRLGLLPLPRLQAAVRVDPQLFGGEYGQRLFQQPVHLLRGGDAGGMDVVDSIAKVKTTNKRSFTNIPVQTITVKSVKVIAK